MSKPVSGYRLNDIICSISYERGKLQAMFYLYQAVVTNHTSLPLKADESSPRAGCKSGTKIRLKGGPCFLCSFTGPIRS